MALQGNEHKALKILSKINGAIQADKILDEIKQTLKTSSEKLFAYGKIG
jgi:SP family xylose:H+ symportor-like MFS transporter